MSHYQELDPDFVCRIRTQIDDADKFFETIEGSELTSVRLNPNIDFDLEGEKVAWNNDGRYLDERPRFKQDPFYHAGAYYPMEASSMFLKYVLDQLEIEPDSAILDLCAAPGGKSLILKDKFPDQLLVSNEIDGKRVHILKENAIKWGTREHLVIQSEASKLVKSELRYGLVVVDAPCSGEGLFRKDKASRTEWTLERAAGCAVRQNEIMDDGALLVEEDGYLIYSTCTYNIDENLKQITRLVDEFGYEPVRLQLDPSFGVQEVNEGDCFGYQFWPHRLKGEGFFISVLKRTQGEEKEFQRDVKLKPAALKSDLIIPKDHVVMDLDSRFYLFSQKEVNAVEMLKSVSKIVKKGTFLGEMKGDQFLPSYDVTHQRDMITDYPQIELDLDSAIQYLKGNALHQSSSKGPVVLTYKGLSLGPGKSNGARINNLYPKFLRIN